jgi:two-component system response regulator PilR (NtrC family)
MTERRALIVDDEADIRELLEITLGRMAIETTPAHNLAEAQACLEKQAFDLCLTDMRLPDGDGIDLVRAIGSQFPEIPVAVITAHGNMDAAIAALKAGAFDFVSKPVELDDLRNLVQQALNLDRTRTTEAGSERDELIGESAAIEALREQVRKVARSQAPVVLTGESGVGKEVAARMIHRLGPRSQGPFVPVNCGAVPSELMESEFFGHRRGSFTGAVADKDGLFVAAEGGTLFLDEVAALPLDMQVKLLRAIQEKRIRPVGQTSEVAVDVRILSASHADLASEVGGGRFRQDLYYRLNVIALHVPPLRERPDDIAPLSDVILARIAGDYGITRPPLDTEALERLKRYPFAGNVRELENILERAVALAEHATIGANDLQLPEAPSPATEQDTSSDVGAAATADGDGSATLDAHLDDRQRHVLMDALERHRWNRTATARELGLTYRQLRYRLKKLGID